MNFRYSDSVKLLVPSAIRELHHFISQPGVISFAGGSPAPESFPTEELSAVCEAVLKEHGATALQYSTTEGLDSLRELIISHMEHNNIRGMTLDNILVTNGSQQALDFIGRLFLNPGDTVICEAPSYLGATNAFHVFGPKFVEVEMDEHGMRPDSLEAVLQAHPEAKFIYAIPTFQNPTGVTMPVERREAVYRIAKQYRVPLIEDDPYCELYYDGEKLPAIKTFDHDNLVIYLGTFSKTFCPGMRIGWMAADPDVIRNCALMKQSTDLHTGTLPQMILDRYVRSIDWEEHLAGLRALYRAKRDAMIETMEQEFPKWAKFNRPAGGLFTWVTLPENLDAKIVLEKCMETKVAFVPGGPFYANGGGENHFRVSFGMMTEEQIREGVRRLAAALKSCESELK